jgi:hypothetical protein
MRRALVTPAILLAATLACAEPLELAEWRIDVPPATPIIELQGVPLEERDAGTVRLVDDLVLGVDDTTAEALLYRPVGIVAAADGRMFVADSGDRRVLRFAADGGYLGSFGREGQGPGELLNIFSMAIAGDRIVIEDLRNGRLSVWTTEGEHVADHSLETEELMDLEGVGERVSPRHSTPVKRTGGGGWSPRSTASTAASGHGSSTCRRPRYGSSGWVRGSRTRRRSWCAAPSRRSTTRRSSRRLAPAASSTCHPRTSIRYWRCLPTAAPCGRYAWRGGGPPARSARGSG